jgi:aminoglycoside phosphotransferase (APT) family kinase protein
MSDKIYWKPNRDLFGGSEPQWKVEPDLSVIEKIVSQHLCAGPSEQCKVEYFTKGAFNRLYRITIGDKSFLMRISLPVDPGYKTRSEVATIEFVSKNTSAPVPQIVAYDDSADNELGFEWSLRPMIPGTTLHERWRKMSWQSKIDLVRDSPSFMHN